MTKALISASGAITASTPFWEGTLLQGLAPVTRAGNDIEQIPDLIPDEHFWNGLKNLLFIHIFQHLNQLCAQSHYPPGIEKNPRS